MHARPWILQQAFALSAALLALTAGCSAVDAGAGGTGSEGDGSAWIRGKWEGTFKAKDADAGTSLREPTQAKARFEEDEDAAKERTGAFRIELPLIQNAFVEGTYRDFQGKSLMLKVKKSTVSTLGIEGATTDLTYGLVGDDLELYNDRVLIRLQRQEKSDGGGSGGGSGSGSGSGDATTSALVGSYTCADDGREWALTIESDTAFHADVRESGRTSSWYKGSVELAPAGGDYDAALTVRDSKDGRDVGLELRAQRFSDGSVSLSVMKPLPSGEPGVVTRVVTCQSVK